MLNRLLQVITVLLIGYSMVAFQKQPSNALSLTPTPTPSAIPEFLEVIEELFLLPNSCGFPCLGRLQVGSTTIEDVEMLVEDVSQFSFFDGSGTDNQRTLVAELVEENSDYELIINFEFEDNVLDLMNIRFNMPQFWLTEELEIDKVLIRQENSPEVFIAINPLIETIEFRILLAYIEESTIFEYVYEFREEQFTLLDVPLELCPFPEQQSYLDILVTQDADAIVDDFPIIEPNTNNSNAEQFYMLQIFFTTLETDAFILELQSNPLECIELLSAPQIYELGYERIYER